MNGGPGRGVRIGLLGRLGAGNLGNDASLEVVLDHLRRAAPAAQLDAMCSGVEVVHERYGLDAVDLHLRLRGPVVWRVLGGIVVDAVRISAWVRRHDVVIVPGMGTLETTLRERPWQMPWTLLVMSLSGRVWGTRVALVGVGADAVPQRLHRVLLVGAARLAHYRSFRDEHSREQMTRMGLPPGDHVFPDVVLALPVPEAGPPEPGTVGVGLMAWSGGNTDPDGPTLHAAYVAEMTRLVELLLGRGHQVRLLVGDGDDVPVAQALLAEVGSGAGRLRLLPTTTPAELVLAVSSVEVLAAARYHNVVCALRCGTPVVALCYAPKHSALLASVGLEELCHDLRHLDADQVVAQIDAVRADLPGVRALIAERVEALEPLVEEHFREVANVVLRAGPQGVV